MYSVIIQNRKTTEEFLKFQPLFAEAVNNKKIGICKWIESGTTIDTAVPELYSLTNDKEEWQAVVVRFEDESEKAGFASDRQNPYDFKINHERGEIYEESPVPIVRLTHMLGGIPAPEMAFVPELVYEENKAPRTIYKPIQKSEQRIAYEALKEKYRFDGKAPSSIVIITVRKNYTVEETIEGVWHTHKEAQSSNFWRDNQYPSICRFLVCDFEDGGPVKCDANEFNFWISVLMLALNDTDSGFLQAYRLYNLGTEMNKDLMAEIFQNMVQKLKSGRYVIQQRIKRDAHNALSTDEKLPSYRMEIPVPIHMPKGTEMLVKKRSFRLFSDGVLTEIGRWKSQKRQSEEMLEKAVLAAERTLDKTADKIKEHCAFDETEVLGLNKYQEEDLRKETDDLYSEIVRVQGILPKSKVSDDEVLDTASKNVRKYLVGRVTGKSACTMFCIVALVVIFSMAPALLINHGESRVDLGVLAIFTGTYITIVLLCALIVLFVQKNKINKLIDVYNQRLKSAFNRLTSNATEYSRYMSAIVSHSRGCSYLNLAARKKRYANDANVLKYRHIKAIDMFLEKIRSWSKAYYLDVDFDGVYIDERATVDVTISPSENKLYTFETGGIYPVEVNNSGTYIDSPFAFVNRLQIVREELYDDDSNT